MNSVVASWFFWENGFATERKKLQGKKKESKLPGMKSEVLMIGKWKEWWVLLRKLSGFSNREPTKILPFPLMCHT